MSAPGHKPPCGAPAAMSEAECIADVIGPKADIVTRMSEAGAEADVISAIAHDRV